MAATNIFYRIPAQRGTRVASIAGTECTLDQFCNHIFNTEGLNRHDFIIASGTKVFRPSSCNLQLISLQNNSTVDILIPLLGGKGGFGSLLRAIGAQIEKTTNRDACRDLSGRRLRDIKREEELKRLLELQTTLEEERKRRRKEKLDKLKKKSEISRRSASIQELVAMFDDHAFNQRRLQLSDIIDAAVDKGLINSKKRQMGQLENESSKRAKLEGRASTEASIEPALTKKASSIDEQPWTCEKKATRSEADPKTLARRNSKTTKEQDLWLGLDEDLEEESDEDQDDAGTKTDRAVVVE